MSKSIIGAFGTIISAIIVLGVLGSADIPDPEREAVNAMPDTDPNIKSGANAMLDVRDTAETAKTVRNLITAGVIIVTSVGIAFGLLSRR